MLFSVQAEERDALCEVAESQNGGLSEVWDPFNKQEWRKAEQIFRQHLQDCQFLEALRRHIPDEDGLVSVGMRTIELQETLARMMARRTAQIVIEESAGTPTSPEQELFQEQARVALRACERLLSTIMLRYEVKHVVVDSETNEVRSLPTTFANLALDTAEIMNEGQVPTQGSS